MTTKQAIEHLERALQDDPEYAWSWHCNIACPIMDEGASYELANKAAARIMKHLFHIDTTKEPNL
jgi:hypothetical protein